jgi:hypothetical protein
MILVSCDPALTALFTPPRPALGRYEVCATAEAVTEVVAAGTAEGLHYGAVEPLESLDGFGTAGPYDRSRLARLYGGTRVQVVHGWKEAEDGGFESITLLSPRPDPGLTRLLPGTLEIRWILSPGERRER